MLDPIQGLANVLPNEFPNDDDEIEQYHLRSCELVSNLDSIDQEEFEDALYNAIDRLYQPRNRQ